MSELGIYLEQAVTMLSGDSNAAAGERERWLDWILSQLLDPGATIALGVSSRNTSLKVTDLNTSGMEMFRSVNKCLVH